MNLFTALALGIIALFLLIAGFFVFFRPRKPAYEHEEIPVKESSGSGKEEFAEEIAPQVEKNKIPQVNPPGSHELPWSYGVDRLVLLARDPYWLYAYWEISATKQEEFNSNYGFEAWRSSRPVLRVYDITGVNFNGENANSYTDISVNESVDNWHINVGSPNRSFCVDLGRIFPDGRFVTILRSNTVTTPRASLSDNFDEEWMWIEGIYRSITRQIGVSSPILIEELEKRMGALPLNISSPGFKEEPKAVEIERRD